MKLNRRMLLAGSLAIAVFISACSTGTPTTPPPAPTGTEVKANTPKYGGVFVKGVGAEPAHLNPGFVIGVPENDIGSSMFDRLVELDFNLQPRASLAKSWTVSPDGLRFEFTLQDAKWHDGQPVTGEDIKFTLEQVYTKVHPRGATLATVIKSIEVPNAKTAVVNLAFPYGPFLTVLGSDVRIMPKHIYAGTDIRTNPANLAPIGSGPFKFVEWVKGSHVIVERNPDYFNPELPYLDRLVFKISPDSTARVLGLESGEIHYLNYVILPAADVERLKRNPNIDTSNTGAQTSSTLLYLTMNNDHAILGKKEVRQAIHYALDRSVINNLADFGLGKPATSPFPSGMSWAHDPATANFYRTDLAKAGTMLDAAGYPKRTDGTRFQVRMIVDRGVPLYVKGSEIIVEQLKAVGITVNLQLLDRASLLDRLYANWDYDLNVHGFAAGADPSIGITRLFHSNNRTKLTFSNNSNYSNPTVDALFDQALNEPNVQNRGNLYKQIQAILLEDLPLIPLLEHSTTSAWRNEFVGMHSWSANSTQTLYTDTWWTKGRDTK